MTKPLRFDKSLQKLEILFRYSGMNLKNKIVNLKDVMKYRLLFILNFFVIGVGCGMIMYYIMIGITKGSNIIELTCMAPCLIIAILGMFKSIIHLIHEDDVQALIGLIRDLETREVNKESGAVRDHIIKEETGFLNKIINVLYGLNISMVIVFDIIPLVLIAVKYYRTNEFDMILPYVDVFLFVPNEMKYWVIAYIQQIWSACEVLLMMGATDYLFFICCTYIRVHFRLLQHDIERLIPCSDKFESTEEDVKKKFAEIVQWHHDLINSSNILEVIYCKSSLFNILSSSLVICFTGFIITIVNDIEVIITFITFLSMGLMQIFFLCFFADMLMRASVEIGDAVYKSGWYTASPSFNKQLLIVQIRSQKPCKLTAAGFADVNLRAFMKVLSTAWSYFALLQTMYSE